MSPIITLNKVNMTTLKKCPERIIIISADNVSVTDGRKYELPTIIESSCHTQIQKRSGTNKRATVFNILFFIIKSVAFRRGNADSLIESYKSLFHISSVNIYYRTA